jgi:hypothetical protein
MFPEYVGVHRARPDEAKPAGIAYGRSKPPAAAPDHSSLNDGVLNSEEGAYAVGHSAGFGHRDKDNIE